MAKCHENRKRRLKRRKREEKRLYSGYHIIITEKTKREFRPYIRALNQATKAMRKFAKRLNYFTSAVLSLSKFVPSNVMEGESPTAEVTFEVTQVPEDGPTE